MLDAYWHGDSYEAFMNECVADQKAFDAAERVARGAIACQADWQAREWAVLAEMAKKKLLVIVANECGHHEIWDKGREPRLSGLCTRCELLHAVMEGVGQ